MEDFPAKTPTPEPEAELTTNSNQPQTTLNKLQQLQLNIRKEAALRELCK